MILCILEDRHGMIYFTEFNIYQADTLMLEQKNSGINALLPLVIFN
jgi:hypothetical protein